MRRTRLLPLFVLLLVAACAEPPSREMNQAKGAIDAARAAGAEQYASTEFAAAVDALARSEQAVTQNDYRLALGLAIESRERAQEAARIAGDNRAKARGDAERVVAEARLRLSQVLERLKDPQMARLSRRALAEPRQMIEAAEKTVQEARTALEAHDYARAIEVTEGFAARIQELHAALDTALAPPPARRRP